MIIIGLIAAAWLLSGALGCVFQARGQGELFLEDLVLCLVWGPFYLMAIIIVSWSDRDDIVIWRRK